MREDGVLIVRDDGVIEVLDAVPVDPDVQQQLDALCDLLGAPRPPTARNVTPAQ